MLQEPRRRAGGVELGLCSRCLLSLHPLYIALCPCFVLFWSVLLCFGLPPFCSNMYLLTCTEAHVKSQKAVMIEKDGSGTQQDAEKGTATIVLSGFPC